MSDDTSGRGGRAEAGAASASGARGAARELPDLTLIDLVRRQPSRSVAVRHGDMCLTYEDLLSRADRVGAHLRRHGVGEGTLVAVRVGRSADMLAALLGVSACGAAYLPIDPADPEARIAHIIADSGASVLLTEPGLALPGIPALHLGDALTATGLASEEYGGVRVDPRSPAYVLYTSGSTGRPKGVVVPHRALVNFLLWARSLLETAPEHVWLALTSLSFDISALELYLPLISGGSCVIAGSDAARDGTAAAALIRSHGVTHVQATPSGWRVLLTGDFPPVVALTGGEALSLRLARRLRARVHRLINVYGPTETTIWSTAWEVPSDPGEIRIGLPVDNTTVHVLDAAGAPAATGELFIGGSGVADGYLGRPALTAERFVPDPFGPPGARLYRTGDLTRWCPDGTLEFGGRSDDQVKLRGHRIELGEIEAVLEEHPAVHQAVVKVQGERLVAFVVGRDEGLREHVARRLPSYMLPSAFAEVDDLPLTPNGKLDRRALPDVPVRAAETAAPARDPLERLVAEVFADSLELDEVGVHDDFFRLGGTSLTSAVLSGTLRARLGLDVRSHIVFAHRTPAELAAWLRGEAAPAHETAPSSAAEYPLSPLQFRLWLSHLLAPSSTAYTVPLVMEMHGALDQGALRAALRELSRRHSTLRTVVDPRDGGPVATVLGEPAGLWVDEQPEDAFDMATEAFLRRPFDLASDLPLRALLLTSPDRHRLVLAIHHLAVDGRSTEIILTELGELYSALLRGTPPTAPATALGFADAVRWQARALDDDVLRRQTGFWQRYLAGTAPARLPIDVERGPAGVGRHRVRELSPGVRAGAEELARRCGTTSFVVLLAAFGSLLGRWSGQRDICVGVPISRRDGPGSDAMVGFFINTVAVRIDLRGTRSFAELTARLGEEWALIQANADVPFDRVLAATGLERPFAVWFNHLGAPESAPAMTGLRTEMAPPMPHPAIYDLNVYLTDDGERLAVKVVGDAGTFDAELAAALLDQYETMLAALVADPRQDPFDLPLPAPGPAPLGTESLPAGRAVRELARRVERGTGSIVDDHGSRSSPDLYKDAYNVAAALERAGVAPGATVAVLAARSSVLPALLLGTWLAGCRHALLDPGLPGNRVAACMELTASEAVLFRSGERPALEAVRGGPALIGMTDAGEVVVEGHARRGDSGGDTGHVVFTSGTTSGPKAVAAGPGPLVHFLSWYCREFGLSAEDRFAFLSGLGHDPLFRDVFAPLWCGGRLLVPPAGLSVASPQRLVSWLSAERITVVNLTPQLSRMLVGAADASGLRLPHLRLVCLGGDAATPRDVRDLLGVAQGARVVLGYGATETPQLPSFRQVTARTAADWAARRGWATPLPLGAGAPGAELVVVTPSGHPAAVGEVGEITVRSRHLALGYLDPELTRARFSPDPAPGVRSFATRDSGRRLPDGTIEFLGRLDEEEVKIRGHRVSLAEVDAVLRRHPRVRESVALARRVGPDLELVCYVRTTDGLPISVGEVRAYLAPHLAAPSLPTLVMHMEEIPLTANGKIDRSALPEPAPQRPGAARPAATDGRPLDEVERLIRDVWAAVLRLDAVGPEDNFFDLGGTSVRMTAVHAALREELGHEIPLLALYEHPTVRALAAYLGGSRPAAVRPQRRRASAADDERLRRLAARRNR
ncbi:amino acid adenylation domain-containing protein [Nonomuraea sp. NPDC050451]|uniref:amino acid adenylation domain-containing protein n=1 Tax=Nonomuraea sp. NPDC050451 TaxID=3364364 RepID=UPI00379A7706